MDIKYIRSFRIFNIAFFDVIASVLVMELIMARYNIPHGVGAVAAIVLGIIVHWMIGIPTELNYKLGISGPPERD